MASFWRYRVHTSLTFGAGSLCASCIRHALMAYGGRNSVPTSGAFRADHLGATHLCLTELVGIKAFIASATRKLKTDKPRSARSRGAARWIDFGFYTFKARPGRWYVCADCASSAEGTSATIHFDAGMPFSVCIHFALGSCFAGYPPATGRRGWIWQVARIVVALTRRTS